MLQKADVEEVLAPKGRTGSTLRVVVISVAAVAIVAAVAGGWLWWSGSAHTSPKFTTEAVARGDIHVSLTATGTLQPTMSVPVSSIASGVIASIEVDYNDTVTKGQPLAHLDMRTLQAKLDRAAATVDVQAANRDAAQASLDDAEAALKRAQGLSAGKDVAIRDVDLAETARTRARASFLAAQAQLKAADADLRAAQDDYSRGVITSPIDGVVLDMSAKIGQSIASASIGQSLFTIASDIHHLDLQIDIDEADVATVTEGQDASFTVEAAPDKPFAGVVRQVRSGPTLTDGVVSYKAVVSVDNTALTLKPGMTATAEIALNDAKDVMVVANSALRFSPAGSGSVSDSEQSHQVWVLRKGAPEKVAVVTGITDGRKTEIVSGALAAGDLVITGEAN